MGIAELIETIRALPEAKQAEVVDFVEFLAKRNGNAAQQTQTLAESSLGGWIKSPLPVENFKPLSREEANAR